MAFITRFKAFFFFVVYMRAERLELIASEILEPASRLSEIPQPCRLRKGSLVRFDNLSDRYKVLNGTEVLILGCSPKYIIGVAIEGQEPDRIKNVVFELGTIDELTKSGFITLKGETGVKDYLMLKFGLSEREFIEAEFRSKRMYN